MTFSWGASLIAAVVLVSAAMRYWLSGRQSRWLARHAQRVPHPFSSSISLADHQRAINYNLDKQALVRVEVIVDAVLSLAFTIGSGIAWLDAVAAEFANPPLLHGLLLLAALTLVLGILGAPLDLYRTFVLEARHGFNKATLRLWIIDRIKGALLAVLVGGPIAACILLAMQWAGALWWLSFWFAWLSVNLLALWLYPTWIAPLFNTFRPLEDDALARRVHALLSRCGYRAGGLYVMDGSRRSAHGNAYFTGTGDSRRIVFFDTLLEKLDHEETEAVLAHELGHFRHRHIRKRFVVLSAASLVVLALSALALDSPALIQAVGLTIRSPAVDLALLSFLLPPVLFFVSPLGAWFSRRHEYEADAFAARQVGPDALARALVKLYRDNAAALTTDPLHAVVFDSHPSALARIARLREVAVESSA